MACEHCGGRNRREDHCKISTFSEQVKAGIIKIDEAPLPKTEVQTQRAARAKAIRDQNARA